MSQIRTLAALPLLLIAGSAMAHDGHGGGFAAGFVHPFSGLDHLLAMLALGLYAARHTGPLRRALPLAFVAAMLAGALLGAQGLALPFMEGGVAASVLVLGLMIAAVVHLSPTTVLPLVAVLGLFHGQAHQAEMGAGSLAAFAAGFAIATLILHGAGFALARWMPQTRQTPILKRLLGAGIAAAGALLLAG